MNKKSDKCEKQKYRRGAEEEEEEVLEVNTVNDSFNFIFYF